MKTESEIRQVLELLEKNLGKKFAFCVDCKEFIDGEGLTGLVRELKKHTKQKHMVIFDEDAVEWIFALRWVLED